MNTIFIDYALNNYLKINILLWEIITQQYIKKYSWVCLIFHNLDASNKVLKKYLQNKIELCKY